MLLHTLLGTTFQLIYCQHSVGNRICSHRIDTGADIIVIVWHTQSIELAGNLLISQLFCKVLYSRNFICRIRLVHLLGIETQFTGDSHLHGQRLHLERLFGRCLLLV